MFDLQLEDRLLARRRFHEWLAIQQLEFTLDNIALLLVASDGTIIARVSGFDDAMNFAIQELQEGASWRLESSDYSTDGIHFAHSASALQVTKPEYECWLVMLVTRQCKELLRMVGLLARLFSQYWDANAQQACEVNHYLLDMTNSLFGKIEVGEVLSETLSWLLKRFSDNQFELLLTQDNNTEQYAIRQLNIQPAGTDIRSKAYLSGHYTVIRADGRIEAAAPLKGKQGSYGVLYLSTEETAMSQADIAYLVSLAECAGSAFEVAKLYEQSTKLVNELRMINEITKRLNRSLQLNEIYKLAAIELLHAFDADYCCILMLDADRKHLVVQASNAEPLLHAKFDIQYGFSGMILHSKEPVIISDYEDEKHVDSELMKLTQARSLIGAPIIFGTETIGAILLAHKRSSYFSYDNFKLLQVLSSHVSLSLNNAGLHAEMRKMVITDQLTGLYVRHYLYEQIQILQHKDSCGSLLVLDLDDFKNINDTYGHQIGDEVLVQVSDIVRRSIRDSDIAARWGGEELAVYLPQMTVDHAYKVAERIRNLIARETEPKVTVSTGIADWTSDRGKTGFDLLFHDADLALYKAKNSGKNQIRVRET